MQDCALSQDELMAIQHPVDALTAVHLAFCAFTTTFPPPTWGDPSELYGAFSQISYQHLLPPMFFSNY
jgi:hypothetical protein